LGNSPNRSNAKIQAEASGEKALLSQQGFSFVAESGEIPNLNLI
jgi:hypothetical protein